ncbi:hypothetical protein [Maribacter sp. ACAM166]|uniref:hypothetical protein n=1 Tax=Maribacter sp. ACAM166 TaxID=2508996 RepID=UPI0010FF0840|nr:hypothetical protein [Maribacter sp. ACAM166]TLP73242.1 hypothetical protein ES765_17415 [Maribacter sp. ACAM166]
MYGYGSHFDKRLEERFGWDWKLLLEESRGLKYEMFKTSKELEDKYSGFGQIIRNNETSIHIVRELNILMIRVGFEWKTCYRVY